VNTGVRIARPNEQSEWLETKENTIFVFMYIQKTKNNIPDIYASTATNVIYSYRIRNL